MKYIMYTLIFASVVIASFFIYKNYFENKKNIIISNTKNSLGNNNNMVNNSNKKEYKIVAFGDSLTAGYGVDLKDSYPSILQDALNKGMTKVGKEILKDISLIINSGEKVAIVGASGSGKSTLLSIISGLDKPSSGKVIIDDTDINTLSEKDLAIFRNKKVGIIFQSFELVQFFTAYENVMLPLAIRNEKDKVLVENIFESIGLSHRKDNMPSTLSGGEQQRTAIARVIASGSEIIFADEPTGNLDATTGKKILDTLLDIVKKENKTFIIITHDMNIASQMDVIYNMVGGKLIKMGKV